MGWLWWRELELELSELGAEWVSEFKRGLWLRGL